MYKVIQTFHDAQTCQLMTVGAVIEWEDADRIKAALERGLIEEIKPAKEAQQKKPAAKKTTSKKK